MQKRCGLAWRSIVVMIMLAAGGFAPARAADSLLSWQDLTALRVYHAYSANDGRTYVEEISLPSSEKQSGGKPAQVYFRAEPHSVAIARAASGSAMDWHFAGDYRHLIISLQGQLFFDLGDGKMFYLKPGEAIFAEDWTGKGHRSGCGTSDGTSCVVIDILVDSNPREIPLRDPPKKP